jgi:hypothetical protein
MACVAGSTEAGAKSGQEAKPDKAPGQNGRVPGGCGRLSGWAVPPQKRLMRTSLGRCADVCPDLSAAFRSLERLRFLKLSVAAWSALCKLLRLDSKLEPGGSASVCKCVEEAPL